ncbi:hypothetical protein [Parasphingorhabdus cellanae]|uniref:Uncharacterized protein n=1 Tax=Parasphingorhabdus cellanae TaxID=2806553 RepID=A0ABX7T4D0_9SPHN|nr:hypothetical protein [Parasphingorhabdus cellanae]QTD56386.1 hypothetical protein J4G78_01930 [Parasphingorhabdus cellanae]
MIFSAIFLAMAASPQTAMPTEGLLTIENLDCISSQVSADKAQTYAAMMRKGEEVEAFESVKELADSCQARNGWSDIQTRGAFRVVLMDGWMLEEGLMKQIQELGDFKPFLDQFYTDNVKSTGRHILKDAFLSGKMDKALSAKGYPEDQDLRELVYNYWEWRGTLYDIEEDFRNDELRR